MMANIYLEMYLLNKQLAYREVQPLYKNQSANDKMVRLLQ